jgi:hypothetical protein
VPDPFHDFMTGKISERQAVKDRRFFRLMHLALAAVLALMIVQLFI